MSNFAYKRKKILLKTIILLLLFLQASTLAQPTDRQTDTYATFQITEQFSKEKSSSKLKSETNSDGLWIYSSLPSLNLRKFKIFSAVEIDLLNKDLFLNKEKINEGIFQRYGVFLGTSIMKTEKQKSAIFIGSGIASDFPSLEEKCGYFHLIYDHQWIITSKLKMGMGILISYNNGSWNDPNLINFLPTIKWDPSPKLDIHASWDNLKIRRFLASSITGVIEVRYDMSFFRLQSEYTVFFEDVSLGTGLDLHLSKDYYLRLRYYEMIYNNNYILNTENNSTYNIDQILGRTLSLSVVFAK